MQETVPIFSSHYSIGRSILTLDVETNEKGENIYEIKNNHPVSIISIVKIHNLKQIFLIDSSFSGFSEAYRNLTATDVQLIYGIKLHICEDINDKSDKGRVNDSKIYLIARNKDGLKELMKTYSRAATDSFYYYPRLDWNQLNKISENIVIWIPFYDGFIHNNLLKYVKSRFRSFSQHVHFCQQFL